MAPCSHVMSGRDVIMSKEEAIRDHQKAGNSNPVRSGGCPKSLEAQGETVAVGPVFFPRRQVNRLMM